MESSSISTSSSAAGSAAAVDTGGGADASSSFRIRRMEARISSIDGSAFSGAGGEVGWSVIDVPASAARLASGVIAKADPFVLDRLIVGGFIIQRHGQMQVSGGQAPNGDCDRIRRGDHL